MVRILVCDDYPGILLLLNDMLNTMGLESACASDGQQALTMVEDLHPDLVISDIDMPGMTGIQLVKTLRQDYQLAEVPCVLLSSVDREQEALTAGCACFLSKPFTVSALRQAVRTSLGSRER